MTPSPFANRTCSTITANTQSIIRVWDDSPDTAIVPARDSQNRLMEFIFQGDRKDLFDAVCKTAIENGQESLTAIGYWNRRNWRKRNNQWGYTWQLVVAAWEFRGISYGHVPTDMLEKAQNEIPA